MPGRRSPYEVEQLRRSLAMLSPGQPSGLSREEAMVLLGDLRVALSELERLERGLRELLDSDSS